MKNLNTLISAVNAHAFSENAIRFNGNERIKVEQEKIEVVEWKQGILSGWHHEVPNDFCIFSDVLDSCAAYVYVKLKGEKLICTLVVSDGTGNEKKSELPPLENSLDDNDIAQRLIKYFVAASGCSD
ncbi:MAG: hypothetical protein MSG64_06910 [Pyrinomonadaceae bacterium MAG19_C2-C3]|nr:hypothetical protein [Pyrinomonadaceae bacterium MAG19_C2-C3]